MRRIDFFRFGLRAIDGAERKMRFLTLYRKWQLNDIRIMQDEKANLILDFIMVTGLRDQVDDEDTIEEMIERMGVWQQCGK